MEKRKSTLPRVWARAEPATPAPTMMTSASLPSADLHSPLHAGTLFTDSVLVVEILFPFRLFKATPHNATSVIKEHKIHPHTYESAIFFIHRMLNQKRNRGSDKNNDDAESEKEKVESLSYSLSLFVYGFDCCLYLCLFIMACDWACESGAFDSERLTLRWLCMFSVF